MQQKSFFAVFIVEDLQLLLQQEQKQHCLSCHMIMQRSNRSSVVKLWRFIIANITQLT